MGSRRDAPRMADAGERVVRGARAKERESAGRAAPDDEDRCGEGGGVASLRARGVDHGVRDERRHVRDARDDVRVREAGVRVVVLGEELGVAQRHRAEDAGRPVRVERAPVRGHALGGRDRVLGDARGRHADERRAPAPPSAPRATSRVAKRAPANEGGTNVENVRRRSQSWTRPSRSRAKPVSEERNARRSQRARHVCPPDVAVASRDHATSRSHVCSSRVLRAGRRARRSTSPSRASAPPPDRPPAHLLAAPSAAPARGARSRAFAPRRARRDGHRHERRRRSRRPRRGSPRGVPRRAGARGRGARRAPQRGGDVRLQLHPQPPLEQGARDARYPLLPATFERRGEHLRSPSGHVRTVRLRNPSDPSPDDDATPPVSDHPRTPRIHRPPAGRSRYRDRPRGVRRRRLGPLQGVRARGRRGGAPLGGQRRDPGVPRAPGLRRPIPPRRDRARPRPPGPRQDRAAESPRGEPPRRRHRRHRQVRR